LALYPNVVDTFLDDFLRDDQTMFIKDRMQPRRDTARAEIAAPALKAICTQVNKTALFDDDYIEVSMQTLGFLKKMDRKERTGGSTTDYDDAVVVLEAYWLRNSM
jgi:hypothetical protein